MKAVSVSLLIPSFILVCCLLYIRSSNAADYTFNKNIHSSSIRGALRQLITSNPAQVNFDSVIYIGSEKKWEIVMQTATPRAHSGFENSSSVEFQSLSKDINLNIKGMSYANGIIFSAKTLNLDIVVIGQTLVFYEHRLNGDKQWGLLEGNPISNLRFIHYNEVLSILQNKCNCKSDPVGIFAPERTVNPHAGFWAGPNITCLDIFVKYVKYIRRETSPMMFAITLGPTYNSTQYSWIVAEL